eukprot:Gb_33137 [translate_table: standard]
MNKGDPKNKETPKSKEKETIVNLTAEIERMKIKLNEKGGTNEKQSKKTGDQEKKRKTKWCHICDKDMHNTKQCYSLPKNKPSIPHYKGKRDEANKKVNYQATDEDDIPSICCPRYMTWGHDAKNCPHGDFKGAVWQSRFETPGTAPHLNGASCIHLSFCAFACSTYHLLAEICLWSSCWQMTVNIGSVEICLWLCLSSRWQMIVNKKDRFMPTREALKADAKEAQAK